MNIYYLAESKETTEFRKRGETALLGRPKGSSFLRAGTAGILYIRTARKAGPLGEILEGGLN